MQPALLMIELGCAWVLSWPSGSPRLTARRARSAPLRRRAAAPRMGSLGRSFGGGGRGGGPRGPAVAVPLARGRAAAPAVAATGGRDGRAGARRGGPCPRHRGGRSRPSPGSPATGTPPPRRRRRARPGLARRWARRPCRRGRPRGDRRARQGGARRARRLRRRRPPRDGHRRAGERPCLALDATTSGTSVRGGTCRERAARASHGGRGGRAPPRGPATDVVRRRRSA
jgi:hypothetical protein